MCPNHPKLVWEVKTENTKSELDPWLVLGVRLCTSTSMKFIYIYIHIPIRRLISTSIPSGSLTFRSHPNDTHNSCFKVCNYTFINITTQTVLYLKKKKITPSSRLINYKQQLDINCRSHFLHYNIYRHAEYSNQSFQLHKLFFLAAQLCFSSY